MRGQDSDAEDTPESVRLSYIIGSYPVLTETFIDREIQLLLDRGVDLEILSIRRPGPNLSPSQQELSRRVRYLLPVSPLALGFAHLSAVVRRPTTYFGTLFWLLTRRGNFARFRTVLHFATGVYAAWVLRDRRGVHMHAHFVDRAATVAMVASRLLDTTYSVTAHAREIYVKPLLLKERIGQATFAVTCTEYNRRHLSSVVGPDVGPRVLRLYHGVDLSAIQHVRPSPRSAPMLLAVAQLMERKGLRYLIEACRLLVDRGHEIRCEIIGDGPLRADLEERIRHLDLGEFVTLVGPRSYPEVINAYGRAIAFVLPCIVASDGDRDGIPNVILEAMAAGLPVISTAVSGIPEVVVDGMTGWLVKEADAAAIADAVEQLLANPDLATRIAEGGRALVLREFDLGRNVDRLLRQFATSHVAV
ncbi:MAG: glycosyltransferase [Actinomycetota bacterium]|nr:glycosyltransferase [Actinomycetota bacterium]